jgi:hypothetical protein
MWYTTLSWAQPNRLKQLRNRAKIADRKVMGRLLDSRLPTGGEMNTPG